jgi:probable phosphoglycerate mutase
MTSHPTTRKLFCFRHGQTTWNAEGRIQGHLDVPLNDLGREQAKQLTPILSHLNVQAFLSSDLSRAHETALIPAQELKLEVATDERLREIHLGKLQGLTGAEMDQLYGQGFSESTRHRPFSDQEIQMLGAETGPQVRDRALAALAEYCLAHPEIERLAVASHGGVVRRLVQWALKIEALPAPIPNGAVYPLIIEVSTRALELLSHLPLPTRRGPC